MDGWVRRADPEDAKWIRDRDPGADGWYVALLTANSKRKDMTEPLRYREGLELWSGGQWAEHQGQIIAWERLAMPSTCGRPVRSDEGALQLAKNITATAATELARAYASMGDMSLPRYSRKEAESAGERMRRFIRSSVFSALSMGADPDAVIEQCKRRAKKELLRREKRAT